jgi:hypothetical protein
LFKGQHTQERNELTQPVFQSCIRIFYISLGYTDDLGILVTTIASIKPIVDRDTIYTCKKYQLKNIINEQVNHLAMVIKDDSKKYKGYIVRY